MSKLRLKCTENLSEWEMEYRIRRHATCKGYYIKMGTIGIKLIGYVRGLKKLGKIFVILPEKKFNKIR